MAKLSSFRTDTRAITDGRWELVDEAQFGDLEIMTRGFTDGYVDARNARNAQAAQAYDGDTSRIPNAKQREINAGLLRDFLVLDVRNLEDDDGQPVTVEQFHAMLADPAYAKLSRAAWKAAGRVSTRSADQLQDVEGNSGPPSGTSSSGPAAQPSLHS